MPLRVAPIRTIAFDYGNTLIEFGPHQLQLQAADLHATLTRVCGPCDPDHIAAVRLEQIQAPYRNGFVENDMAQIAAELITRLYGGKPTSEQIDAVVRSRYQTFIDSVTVRPDVLTLLSRLHERYGLALLSNYPCVPSIVDSLAKTGLAPLLDVVVVSGELGCVKPHPDAFQVLLERLGEEPAACLFVGDNWLADIQGAKRAGMQAVLTTEYLPYERYDQHPDDHQPDATIAHLTELEALLSV